MAAPMSRSAGKINIRLNQFRRTLLFPKTSRLKSSVSDTEHDELVISRDITPFWTMMERRRRQADKTILVKLCDKTPIGTLLQYCSSHGKVSDHFSYFQQGRYAVVEFKSPTALKSLLDVTGSTASKRKGRRSAFIHSRFLTFSRPGSQRQKDARTILNKEDSHSVLMEKLSLAESVSEQISTLMEQEQLQEPEVRLRFLVCSLMEEAFRNILPDCMLYPFGSSVNTFGKRNCDIDMYLDRGTKDGIVPVSQGKGSYKLTYDREAAHSERVATQTTLFTLANYLERHIPHAGSVFRILKASCPLVKFKHHATSLSCDLTSDNRLALRSSELLYIYGHLDSRVRPLIFLVRYWARFHGLTSVHSGYWITNFPLTLLVLYFLQTRTPPVVATMNQLNRLADEHEDTPKGIECSLISDFQNISRSENEETLEELLQAFFHFLCTFNFPNQGISVKRGEPFPNLDDHYSLHIENPLETVLNTSKNVSLNLLGTMQQHAKEALEMMERAEFQRPAEEDSDSGPWGLPLLLFLPNSAGKSFRRSPGLGKRLGTILKDLKR